MMKVNAKVVIFSFLFLMVLGKQLNAQNFVQVQNLTISNPQIDEYWTGAVWVDVDNDKDLDLFLTNRKAGRTAQTNKLYLNNNGVFAAHSSGGLVNDFGYWFGCSWGDVNNDGLIDVYVAGFPAALYMNQGSGNFTKVNQGAIAQPTVAGIGTAFGDLNQDGYLDIVLVRPNWLQGPPSAGAPGSPHIMINSGPPNYTFSRLLGTDVNIPVNDTYLQPTLSDYDGDGDLDLFIGMGSGASKPDLLYENIFADSARLDFNRMQSGTLATDSVEGNQWSFIDIDNDLDLDAYLTNWATVSNNNNFPRSNNLYVNQGGSFTKVSQSPFTTDQQLTTTVCWGDFDNDKDLDAITTSDRNYTLKYYQNDGLGNFTSINAGQLGTLDAHQSGGTVGDFDNDGDLDLFVPGLDTNAALLRNDLSNNNNWIQFKLIGTTSNRSAIGAKVYVKSGGMWQMREVSASSTFFGMNSLIQHFGLASDTLQEVRVKWPSGLDETFGPMPVNSLHDLLQGSGTNTSTGYIKIQVEPYLKLYPNPTSGGLTVELNGWKNERKEGKLDFIDSLGKIRLSVPCEGNLVEIEKDKVELKSGVYTLIYTSVDREIKSSTKVIINR